MYNDRSGIAHPLLAICVIAWLTIGFSSRLSAQALDSLAPGTKIRAVLTGPPAFTVQGTLLRNAADSIIIGGLRAGDRSTFAKTSLKRLDVSNTKRSREDGMARGAKVGALVGLGIGAALITYGAVYDNQHSCGGGDCWGSATAISAVATVPITLVTAILGGVIGAASRDEWVAVRLR